MTALLQRFILKMLKFVSVLLLLVTVTAKQSSIMKNSKRGIKPIISNKRSTHVGEARSEIGSGVGKEPIHIGRNEKINQNALPSIFNMALQVAGPMFFVFLQFSSLQTAWKINMQKSVGNFSIIPFASLFTNCIIWTLYGLLKHDSTVLLPNLSGAIVGAYCMFIYDTNFKLSDTTLETVLTSTANQLSPTLLHYYLLVVAICALNIYFAIQRQTEIIGYIGCLLAVILSASPLAVIRTVLREQNTSSMPFTTSLVTWLNNLSWILYGKLIANDKLIYAPNILAACFSSLQLLLFIKFGIHR